MRIDPDALFTAAALVLGPSPRDAHSNEMTQFQLDLIECFRRMGVLKLDDQEFRKLILTWFFVWESMQEEARGTR
ncbi:MAG: hypothetical protein QG672_1636 [Pseudomonadota bacterium]|jgi:hypothetical protein|nr:hypothetical protein [Pseudomonadota bacterium]